jgi:hypothetical protein
MISLLDLTEASPFPVVIAPMGGRKKMKNNSRIEKKDF